MKTICSFVLVQNGTKAKRTSILCSRTYIAHPLLDLPTSLMPISVVPSFTLNVRPDLVVLLGFLHELHVHVNNTHPFFVGIFGFVP